MLRLHTLGQLSWWHAAVGAALSQWRSGSGASLLQPSACLCHNRAATAPSSHLRQNSGSLNSLQSLGFSRAQSADLAPRLPGNQADLADALDRLGEAVAILRQLGLPQPQATLAKLGAPACFQLDGEQLHSRLQLLCQFLTRAACARLLSLRPEILARNTGELAAIADYLVKQCGYATDVLALMPMVWQLRYSEVVTRREIFAKSGRLSKQPKRQFNQRSVSGCDCFSGDLADFLHRAGVSRAEYDMYAEMVGQRLRASQLEIYVSALDGEDEDEAAATTDQGTDAASDSEDEETADGDDDYNK